MLEWYAPEAGMDALMAETEALLYAVLPPTVTCRGITTSLAQVRAPDGGGGFYPLRGGRCSGYGGRCGGAGRRKRASLLRGGGGLGGFVLPAAAGARRAALGGNVRPF